MTKFQNRLLSAIALLALAGSATRAAFPGPASGGAADWTQTGRTADEQRFSPLRQIDASNVQRLGLAWHYDIGLSRGEEATPLVLNGVMYVSTAWSMVKAFDAASGKLLWEYDPAVLRDTLVSACCDAVNRGVAVSDGKIFVGTLDGRLVALDASNGRPVWSVQTTPKDKPYTITGAPRIAKGLVIIGNGGAELGVRGFVSAYDARTGKRRWRFYLVPYAPGHPDGEISDHVLAKAAAGTWHGDTWWKMGAGGATAWDSMAYDPGLDLLYVGTGNGSPWNREIRSPGGGDNLFVSSIVALRPETGQYVWHYQETPGDEWDFTATQHIVLADLRMGGRIRQVLMQAPKNGFFYMLDRRTGKLISAEKYAPVNWASRIDLRTGRPVIDPAAHYSQTGRIWYGTPGTLGAHNWPPMSYDPQTGLVYIPTQELSSVYATQKDFRAHSIGYNVGVDWDLPPQVTDRLKPPLARQSGYLLAWDPVRGREIWRAPHPTFGSGGVLTTAGNLVFQGNAAGDFKAYRATDGRELWSRHLQAGILAAPITFTVAGHQYIAVLTGCGGVFGSSCKLQTGSTRAVNLDRVMVFRIDGTAQLPPAPPRVQMMLQLPPETASPATVANGRHLYSQYCSVCHGFNAVNVGNQPDLRYSGFLADDGWFDIVLKGALADAGMASFGSALSRDDAAAIRHYVVSRAHLAGKPEGPRPAEPQHSS